jgi:Uncharacterized protein conserved in bacteria (DUF2188)
MQRIQYFVVLHQDQWKIRLNGEHYGPYDSEKTAISAAIDWARTIGNSEVLVQRRDKTFRTEWAS